MGPLIDKVIIHFCKRIFFLRIHSMFLIIQKVIFSQNCKFEAQSTNKSINQINHRHKNQFTIFRQHTYDTKFQCWDPLLKTILEECEYHIYIYIYIYRLFIEIVIHNFTCSRPWEVLYNKL